MKEIIMTLMKKKHDQDKMIIMISKITMINIQDKDNNDIN